MLEGRLAEGEDPTDRTDIVYHLSSICYLLIRFDESVHDVDDAAGVGGDVVLMGDHDDGDAEFGVEVAQELHDFAGCPAGHG